jgi:hypothetical protein
MHWLRGRPFAVSALLGLGLLAALAQPLAARRPQARRLGSAVELLVTSPRDAGPGSLREAIVAADRAAGRARITIHTSRVALETALPPLVNRHGVLIEAEDGAEVDASGLASGPVLDIAAPGSVVQGLTVRGAPGPALLVRASGARFNQVRLKDGEEGIHLAEGVDDVLIEGCDFAENGTGLRVETAGAGLVVRGNRFERHGSAAVWAVAAEPPPAGSGPRLVLRSNRFDRDRISLVLMNVPAEVADNRFTAASEAAVYLTGPASVRGNRIQGSALGVFADAADGALIEENEVDHNPAVGILLRAARATQVRANRVYVNGYGIAVVFGARGAPNVVAENLILSQREDGLFVVGGAPLLRGNRALSNGRAGLRVLDYVPRHGPRVPADPLLQDNVLEGNGSDRPPRGLFYEPEPRAEH